MDTTKWACITCELCLPKQQARDDPAPHVGTLADRVGCLDKHQKRLHSQYKLKACQMDLHAHSTGLFPTVGFSTSNYWVCENFGFLSMRATGGGATQCGTLKHRRCNK